MTIRVPSTSDFGLKAMRSPKIPLYQKPQSVVMINVPAFMYFKAFSEEICNLLWSLDPTREMVDDAHGEPPLSRIPFQELEFGANWGFVVDNG